MSGFVPQVSVVMGACNASSTLPRALDSLLAQEGVDLEVIVVNDGSGDSTGALLDDYARRDTRVRVIHQENRGLTLSLIRGCAEARGEFIARQDADDESLPGRLARQLAFLAGRPDVGFVGIATQCVAPGGESLETIACHPDPEEATRQLRFERRGPPAHGSVMFRRATYIAAGGYRAQFRLGQDSDLWLRMAEISRFGCVQAAGYRFLLHSRSITHQHRAAQKKFGRIAHACREARAAGLPEDPHLRAAEELSAIVRDSRRRGPAWRVGEDVNYRIGSYLARKGHPSAKAYLLASLRMRPWHARAWFRLLQALFSQLKGKSAHV